MTWYDELDKWTADYLPDMPYEREVPLSRYTSFRIGGPARRMAFPQNGEQLILLLSRARELSARPIILGNGTNLLFPDAGVDRLVIHTRDMNRVARVESDPCCLRADAGASLARVAMTACRLGLTGLEFAHGIPGSVGGAVCMNAGAYGGEMSQVVSSAAVLFPDEGIRTLTGEALGFSYRHSLLTDCPDGVVLSAVFRLQPGDPAAIKAKMDELMTRRKTSQPLEYPSAGSTFKRPEGYFAGKLIEDAGLKGFSVGGAAVSEKHAGFVINKDHGTAADILGLCNEVKRRVKESSGVDLELEVKLLGEF